MEEGKLADGGAREPEPKTRARRPGPSGAKGQPRVVYACKQSTSICLGIGLPERRADYRCARCLL